MSGSDHHCPGQIDSTPDAAVLQNQQGLKFANGKERWPFSLLRGGMLLLYQAVRHGKDRIPPLQLNLPKWRQQLDAPGH